VTDAYPGIHVAVLLVETLDGLAVRPGGVYLDATVGAAGHALAILGRSAPGGRLMVVDVDPRALETARRGLAAFGDRVSFIRGSFADLAAHAHAVGLAAFDGIVFDLGFSSDQVGDPATGLSFATESPLDMRLDRSVGQTAGDLVNHLPEGELADIIFAYGEDRRSRRIARAIVGARPLATTTALAAVVARAVGHTGGRIHPATRTFQALRIAVNDELAALERALPQAIALLAPGGRLAVIAFHSLEDRIVKHAFRNASRDCVCPPGLPECRCAHRATLRLVTRRPITPTDDEVAANPRARSARLRIAERLAA
jgi:16S rRNA (cytosine1402-N4)-methyltransferase